MLIMLTTKQSNELCLSASLISRQEIVEDGREMDRCLPMEVLPLSSGMVGA